MMNKDHGSVKKCTNYSLHKLHVLICELQKYVYCCYKYSGIWVYGFRNGPLLVVLLISLTHVNWWWVSSMQWIINNQPRMVVTKKICTIQHFFLYFFSPKLWNIIFMFYVTIIFDRSPCRLAAGTPVKYDCDSKDRKNTFAKSEMSLRWN